MDGGLLALFVVTSCVNTRRYRIKQSVRVCIRLFYPIPSFNLLEKEYLGVCNYKNNDIIIVKIRIIWYNV